MRQKLRQGWKILLGSSILWLSLTSQVMATSKLPQSHERHILERLSFGVTSSQIEQINTIGTEAYIQSQLSPQLITESPIVDNYLAKFRLISQEPIKLQIKLNSYRKKLRNPQLPIKQKVRIDGEIRNLNVQLGDEAISAHLARAIYSNRQLQEVMVDFWFNHFNVFATKGATKVWLSDYENKIRTHALGNFRDLLEVTAKHPAMLIYLDNKRNTDPNSPAGKRRQLGLNENYARELMELHTLGVDGGYTQDDVIALARILTGWGVDHQGQRGDKKGFFFHENRHDQGDKLFLGHLIAANGIQEGEQALDILASHPATARFISYKLAQYFVADQPPDSLVEKLAQEFIESQGNIKTLMDVLIHSQEFNDPLYYKQKFKTPYQYVISLVRMGEIRQPNLKRIRGMLRQLSMPVYQCVPPHWLQKYSVSLVKPSSNVTENESSNSDRQWSLKPWLCN